ncbi:hypothetical protein JOC76_001432 [Neobacillus cucumis]|nr:hypothetical protein [Neobacillus cucumis]
MSNKLKEQQIVVYGFSFYYAASVLALNRADFMPK